MIQAELKQAVFLLGGARRAERLTGVSRTVLDYWCHVSIPEYRHRDAEKVIVAARDVTNHRTPANVVPPWAQKKLEARRKHRVVPVDNPRPEQPKDIDVERLVAAAREMLTAIEQARKDLWAKDPNDRDLGEIRDDLLMALMPAVALGIGDDE